MIELLGVLATGLFAYSAVPTALATFKARKSIGTPINLAWTILSALILMGLYVYLKFGFDLILTVSYSVEYTCWAVVIYFHYFPKKLEDFSPPFGIR